MRAWMVRAGRRGEREIKALTDGVVIAGWEEVEDNLSDISSSNDLLALLVGVYPDVSPQVISNWTGQLWRFREEIDEGDLVVMPVSSGARRQIAVGTVIGRYCYEATAEPGFRHMRPVHWVRKDIDRDAVLWTEAGVARRMHLVRVKNFCQVSRQNTRDIFL